MSTTPEGNSFFAGVVVGIWVGMIVTLVGLASVGAIW